MPYYCILYALLHTPGPPPKYTVLVLIEYAELRKHPYEVGYIVSYYWLVQRISSLTGEGHRDSGV